MFSAAKIFASSKTFGLIRYSSKMAAITMYNFPPCPFCRSLLMLVKHLGIELNVKNVDVFKGENKTPEYSKINPQHIVPTIDDNGFYLWESRAIQTYLVNKYAPDSPVYPKDPKERAIVDRMLYFDIGTLFKAEYDYLHPMLFKGQPDDPEKAKAFKKSLILLEGFLAKTPYAAGECITLADFSLLATLTLAEVANYSFAEFPKISAWTKKLKSEIPSYHEINDEPINEFKEFLKSKV